MREGRRRSSSPRVGWSMPTVFVLLPLLVIGGALLSLLAIRQREASGRLQVIRQEISMQEEERKELEALVQYLSSPTFTEREAREKLGLAKPGESVIIVPERPQETILPAGETAPPPDTTPNPIRWSRYFFR